MENDHSLVNMDPDWQQFSMLAHRAVDDVVTMLSTIRERPVWQPVPPLVRANLRVQLPQSGQPADKVYADFKDNVFPYCRGNFHPRFWGWVNGSGLPIGILADFLASAMNCSVGAFENSATMVEEQVISWLKEILDWDSDGSGLLTSGCSMGNLIGLAAARHGMAGFDVRLQGLVGGARMTVYASAESHSSVRRAVEILGFGGTSLRSIPVMADRSIDTAALEATIEHDVAAGLHPICVVGNAGTVNTGAVDPLNDLADICARRRLWLHIDGAFGALAWLSEGAKSVLFGMNRADSIAFDLHKWMYLPFDVSCVLVKDAKVHLEAFSTSPAYLSRMESGPANYPVSFPDRGIELTRRFRALKVWFALRCYGRSGFAEAITNNLAQARYLAQLVSSHPNLTLVGHGPLNVVCFRYVDDRLNDAVLDGVNGSILTELQRSGLAVPSHTVLENRFVIRVAITNHRSTREDFAFLVDKAVEIGNRLTLELVGEKAASLSS